MITRRLPLALSAMFLAITLARVANLAAGPLHAGVLGWLYAVGLGLAVYTAAFWTRTATTRRSAAITLAFFVLVDCYMNLVDVLRVADMSTTWLLIAAWAYGLFPTLAVGLLGLLQAQISRLPPVHGKPQMPAIFVRSLQEFVQRFANYLHTSTRFEHTPTKSSKPFAAVCSPLECPVCHRADFSSVQARNAHMGHCMGRRNGHKIKVGDVQERLHK
jgi:hypothetical protein